MLSTLALALLLWLPARATAAPAPPTVVGHVVFVVDGDTIHVQIGDRVEKVRYIGVDAPEIPHPRGRPAGGGHDGGTTRARPRRHALPNTAAAGEAARRINIDLVGGRLVRLEFDRQRRDDYRRLLAYVWVDDTMVNAEMVKRGYAEVMSIPPDFRHRALLLRLQQDAREAGRGLWREAPAASIRPPRR
jgi:micrococcal nuclease